MPREWEQTNQLGELLGALCAQESDHERDLEICTDSHWLIDRVERDLPR